MRPVNLIPPEERRDKAPIRTGPIAYILVGALALALGAVTLVVLTDNKVADRKAEITRLKGRAATAKARADELAPFASFSKVEQQRMATVSSLADSRFDWERVMRELALVIPSDVWLTDLTGTVASGASAGGGSSTDSGGASIDTSSISGPSLQLKGCAAGHDAVAGFLSALRDIDGVTRVGLSRSERPSSTQVGSSSTSGISGGAGNTDCRTRDFIAQFEIVAAFDAVPAPQIPAAAPSTSAVSTATAAPASSTESTPASATTGTTTAGP
jgi:Tfp pilus assembly protein PilN